MRERALQAVRELCEHFESQQEGSPAAQSEEALLFAYFGLVAEDRRWTARAIRRLNEAIGGAGSLVAAGAWGLHDGLAGLGWIVDHLSRLLGSSEAADLNASTDVALLRELQRGRWRGAAGLEHGLIGIGVYFLDRGKAEGVDLVAAHLESLREIPPAEIPYLVAFAAEAGATSLFDRATRSLPDSPFDLRAAAILCSIPRAGCAATGRRFLDLWLDETYSVDNVSLRDGAAGIAHTLRRIDDVRCRELAPRWEEQTLSMFDRSAHDRSFLDGGTGAALAILASLSPIDPAWDRRMMLPRR